MPTQTTTDLKTIASDVLSRALKAGATDAEAVVYEGDEFSASSASARSKTQRIRLPSRRPARLSSANSTASTSSSDFSPEGLTRLVEGAVTLARITSEDPFAGLPEARRVRPARRRPAPLLRRRQRRCLPAERIEIARRTEAAAIAYDTRIQNSRGGDFDTATSHKIMMNSRGFIGEYRRSYCGFSASPIAQDDKRQHAAQLLVLQRPHHHHTRRPRSHRPRSRTPRHRAPRRTPRPNPASPRRLLPEIARSIIGNIFDAANGDAIYRNASFFSGMLGEQVAGENITVIDDGTLIFDHDGKRSAASAPAPSTAKAFPPAAPSSSSAASSRTTS